MTARQKNTADSSTADEPRTQCGIIMPISATATHSEKHWADVQTLLHRAVHSADMEPVNVWTGEVADRVSERIVGNIFRHEIVIADISDLNPNVMLELGLRLASKKPTLVVVNSGGTIPFDIRDFHAIHYPSDLNMLEMEAFFEKLSSSLKAKYASYLDGSYSPFLGHVVVDVLSPETRQVPLNELIVDRLEDLGRRLSRIEIGGSANRQPPTPLPSGALTISSYSDDRAEGYFRIPAHLESAGKSTILEFYDDVRVLGRSGADTYMAGTASPPDKITDEIEDAADKAVFKIGGSAGIPDSLFKHFKKSTRA